MDAAKGVDNGGDADRRDRKGPPQDRRARRQQSEQEEPVTRPGLEVVFEVETRGEPEGERNGEGSGARDRSQDRTCARLQQKRQRQVAHYTGNQQGRRRRDARSAVVAEQEANHHNELAGCRKPKGLGDRQRLGPVVPRVRTEYCSRSPAGLPGGESERTQRRQRRSRRLVQISLNALTSSSALTLSSFRIAASPGRRA